jgi:hypothetical protein
MLSDAATKENGGWGARIRTWEWRNQNPLPYHLATPQQVPESRTEPSRTRRPDHSGGARPDQRPHFIYTKRALTGLWPWLD